MEAKKVCPQGEVGTPLLLQRIQGSITCIQTACMLVKMTIGPCQHNSACVEL